MIPPTPDTLLSTSLGPGRHVMRLLAFVKCRVAVYSSESMTADQKLYQLPNGVAKPWIDSVEEANGDSLIIDLSA